MRMRRGGEGEAEQNVEKILKSIIIRVVKVAYLPANSMMYHFANS